MYLRNFRQLSKKLEQIFFCTDYLNMQTVRQMVQIARKTI